MGNFISFMRKNDRKALCQFFASAAVVGVLFLLSAFLSQKFASDIRRIVGEAEVWGMLLYVGLTILAIVLAPVSTTPLLPLAANLWGGFWAAVLSIIGWTAGAQIAFWIARKYGRPIVEKVIPAKKLQWAEERLSQWFSSKEHFFWTVVFLRMALPVDILSYALGLFTRMNGVHYFFATLIGVTPFGFFFSYAGTFPVQYQIAALTAALIIVSAQLVFFQRRRRRL